MKYIKRIVVILLIALISICAVFYSYYGIKNGAVVFADSEINYMSDAELEAAYQAYLQSKGGGFLGNAGARLAYTNGKMLNFLTSESNTTPFKNINDIKGLMSWQKSELESGNSSVLQLSMSQGGASVFSLYTQWLLQNHYFGNGVNDDYNNSGLFEDGTENIVYSGSIFTDADGNNCLVFICNINTSSVSNTAVNSSFSHGTPYKYNYNDVRTLVGTTSYSPTFHVTSETNFNPTWRWFDRGGNEQYITNSTKYNSGMRLYAKDVNGVTIKGYPAIIYNAFNSTYYVGYFSNTDYYNGTSYVGNTHSVLYMQKSFVIDNNNVQNTNIVFYTNNNMNITDYPDIEAEGNLYITPKVKINGEYKPYTVNEGDNITNVVNNYYNDSGDKDKTIAEPTTTPDSGGGGGNNNPSGGTPPNWNNPWPNLSSDGEGGFNFNFTLPDLNIDWNINGLTEKFPFSIPFDFIAFCRVLNAEPQTPEWSGTLTLPMVNYPFTFSLQQFDNVATLLRNMEFIGFCIALILATRALIKG